MVDLVGTVALDDWEAWLAEGDAAGDAPTGEEWGWYTKHSDARRIRPGERFYIVSHGLVRGFAPVTRIERNEGGFVICRRSGAFACTVWENRNGIEAPMHVPGFRGVKPRWWALEMERAFPNWKTEGVTSAEERRALKRAEALREREHARGQTKTLFD